MFTNNFLQTHILYVYMELMGRRLRINIFILSIQVLLVLFRKLTCNIYLTSSLWVINLCCVSKPDYHNIVFKQNDYIDTDVFI